MVTATRIQIFDILLPYFAFAKTKSRSKSLTWNGLFLVVCRVLSAFIAELGSLLCPNGRHRIKQF